MEVSLKRACVNDRERIWRMQKESFAELYQKYGGEKLGYVRKGERLFP